MNFGYYILRFLEFFGVFYYILDFSDVLVGFVFVFVVYVDFDEIKIDIKLLVGFIGYE